MYELKRTQARAAFKDLLGQANHFLITILVGLNGVRSGQVDHDVEFRAAWNPKNVKASADRSRVFALDLALVRAIDALDAYMMMCRRAPSALGSPEFETAMDGAGQSVSKRFSVFLQFIDGIRPEHCALMRLAIAWRNRRVHSLAENDLRPEDRKLLLSSSELYRSEFRGLSVSETISRFDRNESPHFKDAAGVIALTHKLVENFDRHLLETLSVEEYIRVALRDKLAASSSLSETEQLNRAARKIWSDREGRPTRAVRALRFVGVHPVDTVTARLVPDELIAKIVEFAPAEAVRYLSSTRPEQV